MTSVSTGDAASSAAGVRAPLLELVGVSCLYGKFLALSDVSLSIQPGSVVALIGPNGAGKSTMASVISGDQSPSSGEVRFQGRNVTRLQLWRRARLGLGRSYQVARLFDSLSVRSNLEVAYRARASDSLGTDVATALDLVGLTEIAGQVTRDLSEGDRKRVELGMLTVQGARLLVLDEPTAGMSAAESLSMAHLIVKLKSVGATILIIEHDMDVVFHVAEHIAVLHQGAIVFEGRPEEVLSSRVVKDVYLGTTEIKPLVSKLDGGGAGDSKP
jgi:branched-chain amino acid transport system ATP-binding protein